MKNLDQVSRMDALEIVFEHRNKAYGAYQLRREYNGTLGRALGFTILIIIFLLLLPRILGAFAGGAVEKKSDTFIYDGNGKDFKKPKEVVSLPKTKAAALPRAIQRFTAPKITKDDQTQDPETNAVIDDLINNNKAIGSQNMEGSEDLPPILEDETMVLVTKVETNAKEPEETYDGSTVQKMPVFVGGEPELFRFINKNISYPEQARELGIQGVVVVSFVVRKDGSATDIKLLKDIGGGCGKEALRVVQSMPYWIPGEMNGTPVNVRFTLPIRFHLN